MTTLDGYGWSGTEPQCDALTLTFIRFAGAIRDVLRAGGHTWVEAGQGSFSSALDIVDGFDIDREPLLVGRLGDWVVLLAPNGYEYSLPNRLAGASRLGTALSVFWNVNAVMQILVAEGGTVTRSFDPLMPEDSDGVPLPEERGLPFGHPEGPLRPACLLFAERVTGQEVTRDWLLGTHDLLIVNRRDGKDGVPD